jgi:hypothetical protein
MGKIIQQESSGLPTNKTEQTNIEGLKKEFKEQMEIQSRKFAEDVEKTRIKVTEMIAIFVTLFTFISVNITIFTKVEDLITAIYFMIIMTLCCIILLSTIFLLIDSVSFPLNKIIGLIFVLFFLCFLIFLIQYGSWNPKLNKETVTSLDTGSTVFNVSIPESFNIYHKK